MKRRDFYIIIRDFDSCGLSFDEACERLGEHNLTGTTAALRDGCLWLRFTWLGEDWELSGPTEVSMALRRVMKAGIPTCEYTIRILED